MVDKPQNQHWTWAVILGALLMGCWIRFVYVDSTPASIRAHDFQGHMDYLAFVLEQARIPNHDQGFQGYQPPLYYFLAAPMAAPGPHGGGLIVEPLQQLSLWISCLTLGLGLWVGTLLYRDRPRPLAMFSVLLAAFPGLVYGASQVTNDGLVQLLLFGAMGLLICWWQTGRDRWWIMAAAATGIGVLVKSNALLMLPIAMGMLWVKTGLGRRARLRLLGIGTGIVVALSGWLIVVRMTVDRMYSVVPNTDLLPRQLHLSTGPWDLLGFNPVRLLQHPFGNDVVHLQQAQGFWEYYFRSAFFGEWSFDPALLNMAWLILLLALLLVVVMGMGLWHALRHQRTVTAHIWVPLVALLGTHWVYRIVAPFTPSQDFRYTSLVLLPAAWLVLDAAARLPGPLKWLAWGAWLMLTGLCAFFLVSVGG